MPFAPLKTQLVTNAEVIAVVEISEVREANAKVDDWTSYRQQANPMIEKLLKGNLPEDPVIYGQKNMLDDPPRFAPKTKYLVFLRLEKNLWVSPEWFTARPIKDDKVDWFSDEKHIVIRGVPLADVLQDIEKILETASKKR